MTLSGTAGPPGVKLSRYDLVQAYMAVGGIPYYLNFFRKGLSLAQNIDAILFDPKAKLKSEFSKLFTKRCGYTREEIARHLGIAPGGTFSSILEALEESDFIHCYRPFDAAPYEKLYRLIDSFCITWLFWKDKKSVTDTKFWQHNVNSTVLYQWGGIAFEEVCFRHVEQIKRALGVAAVQSECSPFTLRGTEDHDGLQCDMIISRADHIVNLCEMKYSMNEFTIDKSYDRTLRCRMETVRQKIKKTQQLHLTFVTTFGVKQNMYSGCVQSYVTLDDLFKPMIG